MKKIKLISAILVALYSSNMVADDFYYKSKQQNNTVTIYEKLVTDSMIVKEVILNERENKREVRFKGLQNKNNINNKYKGNISVEKKADLSTINLELKTEDNRKNLDIFLGTQDSYNNFLALIMKSNYGELLKFMSKGFFELNLLNQNDTSYLLSMLSVDNKKKLLVDLAKENSNNVMETLKMFNEGEKIKISNYNLNIENILNLELQADLMITEGYYILTNINLNTNVIKKIEGFSEIESVFGIDLEEGQNSQIIEEMKIKIK